MGDKSYSSSLIPILSKHKVWSIRFVFQFLCINIQLKRFLHHISNERSFGVFFTH